MMRIYDLDGTIRWYYSIGFQLVYKFEQSQESPGWAYMKLGGAEFMLIGGGERRYNGPRDIDMYFCVDDVIEYYNEVKLRAEVKQEPHESFYGMFEFTVEDINGFWLTFGQSAKSAQQIERPPSF